MNLLVQMQKLGINLHIALKIYNVLSLCYYGGGAENACPQNNFQPQLL